MHKIERMKIETKKKTNWIKLYGGIVVILGAIIFWWDKTRYFGFNDLPCCPFEGQCDIFSLAVIFIGCYLIVDSTYIETSIHHD